VSLDPERTPVVVGVGQVVDRQLDAGPIELAEQAARAALDEAPGLAGAVERLSVVNILSRRAGTAPATDLAKRLGIAPAVRETTTVGGNTPQWLVNRAAADIFAGRLEATLVVGAEAVRSRRLDESPAPRPGRPREAGEADDVVGGARRDLTDEEHAAGLYVPVQVYPLFESVLARRAGRDAAAQRLYAARLLSRFTEVAARHPCAWFPERRRPEEIAEPSPDNRLVAEPYTKRMTAFIGPAQGAALLLTSLARARSQGLADQAVFVWAGAELDDVWFPLQRPDLGSSPAIRQAGEALFAAAGVGVDDVDRFDLYSCFPSAVEMAAEALGLRLEDPRGLTVTGGLPYFGGPGNNYATHAIATIVERLRDEGGLGLVTALGWYATKHALGLYGAGPPPRGYRLPDLRALQRAIDATARPYVPAEEEVAGPAVVEASTVLYDHSGVAVGAPVVATLADGRRCAADAVADELPALAGRIIAGRRIVVSGRPRRYRLAES
jgi:acetyl-CoA C-acetyltransferase